MFIGEALVGDGNEIAHIDLLIGARTARSARRSPTPWPTSRQGPHQPAGRRHPEPDLQAGHGDDHQGHDQGAPSRRCRCSARPRPPSPGRSPTASPTGVIPKSEAETTSSSAACSSTGAGQGRHQDLPVQLRGHQAGHQARHEGRAEDRRDHRQEGHASTRSARSKAVGTRMREPRGPTVSRGSASRVSLASRSSHVRQTHDPRPARHRPAPERRSTASSPSTPGVAAPVQLRRRDARDRDAAGPRVHLHPRAEGPAPHRHLRRRLRRGRRARRCSPRCKKHLHPAVRADRLGDARLERGEHHRRRRRPRRRPAPRPGRRRVAGPRRHRPGRAAGGPAAGQARRARPHRQSRQLDRAEAVCRGDPGGRSRARTSRR